MVEAAPFRQPLDLLKSRTAPRQTGHHPGNVSWLVVSDRGRPGFDIFRKK
jgi:hypothetical protein